ncbi:MAG: deoxyribodipyrimidine photolyase [Lacipirellulaceae bacterium]
MLDTEELASTVPAIRVRRGHASAAQVNGGGRCVLYWMTAFRRPRWNFALDRAIDWARAMRLPLVVLEALRVDYRWASDRFHTHVVEGMRDNRDAFASCPGVVYHPYVEPARGDGAGLLAALAAEAAVVVGDDYPTFFLPAQTRAAARSISCRFELVDSNGLYPMHATDRVFGRAFDFRRHLQKELLPHLAETPSADPLTGLDLPSADGFLERIAERWPAVSGADLDDPRALAARLPIDHAVKSIEQPGGWKATRADLERFLDRRLEVYGEKRGQPEEQAASELSFALHWGHLSAHEAFDELCRREGWTPDRVAKKVTGSSSGWWGMSPTAESFLDELLTWREVGFNMASKRRDHDRYESLPEWVQKTLGEHANDPREHLYTLDEFEHSRTHDELWNAAQRQLVREGRVHNYLRMLWGKKILQWSESPREAARIMIELNNKYALDGRDPNSYSGIFWVLGRYDRPWAPQRPVFGMIRYMSSENTARKVSVKQYLKRYAAEPERSLF